MSSQTVIMGTTAPAGSGKSYRRCAHYLAKEFLPNTDGIHISNFPVNVPELLKFVSHRTGRPVEEFDGRVLLIPEDVLAAWREGKSGPWDYFADWDLSNCHIAIDECHHFIGRKHKEPHRQKWQAWLGEIRHMGATIEFISQTPNKVAREVWDEAGMRLSLVNSETRRDPFFRILLEDWYNLRAPLTGGYLTSVWELEYRQVDARWVLQDKRVFTLDPELFPLYNSYSKPQAGGNAGKKQPHACERMRWPGVAWWFVRRNWLRVLPRFAILGVFLWVMSGGGATLMAWNFAFFQSVGKANKVGQQEPSSSPPSSSPPAPPLLAAQPAAVNASPMRADLRERVAAVSSSSSSPPATDPALIKRLELLEKQNAELQEKLAQASTIALLTADAVTFRNGYSYHVGEVIDYGPHKGKRLIFINWPRRLVVLEDGQEIRMGG